jgi:hypothetical protein
VVGEFRRGEHRPSSGSFLGGRCSSVAEIVKVAYENRERNHKRALFEAIWANAKTADNAFITELTDEFRDLLPTPHVARLLIGLAAWRQDEDAINATAEEYDRSEEEAAAEGD